MHGSTKWFPKRKVEKSNNNSWKIQVGRYVPKIRWYITCTLVNNKFVWIYLWCIHFIDLCIDDVSLCPLNVSSIYVSVNHSVLYCDTGKGEKRKKTQLLYSIEFHQRDTL